MTGSPRLRALAAPSALALLVVVVVLARPGMLGALLFVVLLLALLGIVGAHLRLQPPSDHGRGQQPLLRTPAQVGLGVAAVVVVGSLVAVVASVVLATFTTPMAGDGNTLLRLCLAVFALGPCVSIGRRCGRWWAFLGSAGLAPLLGVCVLIVGPRSWSGVEFVLLTVTAVAVSVAAGSLQRALTGAAASRRSRSSGSRSALDTAAPRRETPLSLPATAAGRRQGPS